MMLKLGHTRQAHLYDLHLSFSQKILIWFLLCQVSSMSGTILKSFGNKRNTLTRETCIERFKGVYTFDAVYQS